MSDNVGQSYNEQILQSIIDGSQYVNENPYPSRIEQLLMELKEVIEQGGGTSNYEQLTNKPSINNVTLTGNKTTSELGIVENVQADWTQTDTTADDYIKNKPTIPAAQVNADWNAVSGVAQILNKPTIPTVDQSYSASSTNAQSGTAVASAISGKISATDYATQNTGGTIKAWTTTDGSDTILHLATQ